MLVNLTQKQLETIIQALEKEPEQINDMFSVRNYLKIVIQNEPSPVELDDILF